MKDLLVSDHRELDLLLAQLFAAFDQADAAQVYEKLDFFWARLAMHIRAEHLHLFPAILNAARKGKPTAANGSVPSPEEVENSIGEMRDDHHFFMRELGAAVRQLFALRDNKWRDESKKLPALRERIDSLVERLKTHNELEEARVYRWAEIFAPAELPVLHAKIRKELENLPPRFVKTA